MEKLLHIAEEIIQLLPKELLQKYTILKSQLLKNIAKEEYKKDNSQLEDISLTSFRNKLGEYQNLKITKHNVGIQHEVDFISRSVEAIDVEKQFLKQQLDFLQTIKQSTIDTQTQQPLNEFLSQTDFQGVPKGIQEQPVNVAVGISTDEPVYQQQLVSLIMSIDKSNSIENYEPKCLFENVQKIVQELSLQQDETELWKLKYNNLNEQFQQQQSSQKELEKIFNQVLKETKKFKNQEEIQIQQEESIKQFENTILQLQIKLTESEIMQKKSQDAYFLSMQQLKQKSDKQMSRLQEQLAVTHDRLRKIQKNVESVDSSLFDSILSK